MLLLSGVLLVMGFVVMGTTLVQLQGMEGSTERTQRDSLMNTVDDLIAGLNQTIQDSIVIGETNKTSFQETLRNAEKSLRDNAVRSGVYASVELSVQETDDLKPLFWRESRCIGYNPDDSEKGLILGWHADTFEESIAGAVYDIHVTDGRQSFRSLVYVKIMDCAVVLVTSTHTTLSVVHGTVEDEAAMRKADGLSTAITEELDMDNLVEVDTHPYINRSTIDVRGNWHDVEAECDPHNEDCDPLPNARPVHMLELDGNYTRMSSNLASLDNIGNHFRFQLTPPERMNVDDTLPNVTLDVTGFKDISDPLEVQKMILNIYPDQSALSGLVPSVTEEIPLETGPTKTHEIVIDQLTPDEENWTYAQLEDSVWELTVIGDHLPSQHWYIDAFNMTGGMTISKGYRMDVELDWQDIPDQYLDHELHVRYRLTPATVDEGFHLQVRDTHNASSTWTTVHNMTDTSSDPGAYCDAGWDAGWCSVTYTGPVDEPLPNRPAFRIIDSIDTDNWIPDDQDTLEIEHLFIKSRLTGT